MSEAGKVWAVGVSRRGLLHGAARATGAAAMLGAGVDVALAAKMLQPSVSYQGLPKGSQTCGNCKQFQPPGACRSVEGPITPSGWCRIWQQKA